MSTVFASGKLAEQEYKLKMAQVRDFSKSRRLPWVTRQRLRAFFEHMYEERTVFDEKEIIDALPERMRLELVKGMYEQLIKMVPLFAGLGDEITCQLCGALKPMPALDKDIITQEGERGTEMYFIMSGEVEVLIHGDLPLGFLHPGAFFGEMELLGTRLGICAYLVHQQLRPASERVRTR